MDNSSSEYDYIYDVFIEEDFKEDEMENCYKYDGQVLATQFMPRLYLLVFVLGLVGNTLILVILIKYKRLKLMVHLCLLNLAISNLLFLLTLAFGALTSGHGWAFSDAMCQLISGFYSLGLFSQSFFIVFLMIQKYLWVVRRLTFHSKAKAGHCGIITSALIWGLATLAALPDFLLRQSPLKGESDTCRFSKPHYALSDEKPWIHFLTLRMSILALLFPLLVAIFCSVGIIKVLRRQRIKKKVTLTLTLVIVFFLFWTPYNLVLFFSTFSKYFSLSDCESSYRLDRAIQVTNFIADTHCCINPVICVLLQETFRKSLCRLFIRNNSTPCHPVEGPEQTFSPPREQLEHSSAC
ncbi:C-C chemokine receptor-like 2 [Tachyglossus aculeatus]|uniref:C-C chemokine receptor-like 2 n=1 Tax=Tachyglossus aculeatus TaxID=9261 RepID=UPI0018F3610F|nr:C-C chemokine receptor-like 2 [Tachyglossus aculeatus]